MRVARDRDRFFRVPDTGSVTVEEGRFVPCPECEEQNNVWHHGMIVRGPRREDFRMSDIIGMRLYCLSCEHIWDRWLPLPMTGEEDADL